MVSKDEISEKLEQKKRKTSRTSFKTMHKLWNGKSKMERFCYKCGQQINDTSVPKKKEISQEKTRKYTKDWEQE